MGWFPFPNLKSEKVVCQGPCNHKDCAAWRATDTHCLLCGKEIKAKDAVYYFSESQRYAHIGCVLDQAAVKP